MLGNENLWDVANQCHVSLQQAQIPHVLLEGVAVCLHGYQRNTVDVDMLIRSSDSAAVRGALQSSGFSFSEEHKEFRSPSGVPVQFQLSGDRAGAGSEVCMPDPTGEEDVTEIEGLPVLSLAKLIEVKLACGEGNLRRTHKDFADVVELIAHHQLSRSFARHIHKSLRPTFRELVLRARGG